MLFERSIRKIKERPGTAFPPNKLSEVGSPFGLLLRRRDCSSAATEPTSTPEGTFVDRDEGVFLDCAKENGATANGIAASKQTTNVAVRTVRLPIARLIVSCIG